jgi:hypothetical protein
VRLTLDAIETTGIFGRGEQVVSLVFPGLSVPVDAVFAP